MVRRPCHTCRPCVRDAGLARVVDGPRRMRQGERRIGLLIRPRSLGFDALHLGTRRSCVRSRGVATRARRPTVTTGARETLSGHGARYRRSRAADLARADPGRSRDGLWRAHRRRPDDWCLRSGRFWLGTKPRGRRCESASAVEDFGSSVSCWVRTAYTGPDIEHGSGDGEPVGPIAHP